MPWFRASASRLRWLALTAALFFGCASSPPEPRKSAPPPPPALGTGTIFADAYVADRLEIGEARLTRNAQGKAMAQVDLRNPGDRYTTFSQKLQWLDPNGQVLLSEPSRWKVRSIGRRSQETISSVAYDAQAADFRLQLVQRGAHAGTLRRIEKTEAETFPRLDPSQFSARDPDPNRVALVIGIENYKRLPKARHARSDARAFSAYAQRVLGVPKRQVIEVLDADADHFGIEEAVRRVRADVTPQTDLFVFFSGHGFSSGDGVAYLLPQDGDARFLDRLASRDQLFASLGSLGAHSVTVFLDTCYSGRSRGGQALHEGMRPLVLSSGHGPLPEGFTVFSAAGASEFSSDLPGSGHGLFSYYLMRGLAGEANANGDAKLTAAELHAYVRDRVSRQAGRQGREQHPEIWGRGEDEVIVVRY